MRIMNSLIKYKTFHWLETDCDVYLRVFTCTCV